MEFILNLLSILTFIAIWPVSMASISASNNVHAHLRQHHPALFDQLGRPSVWGGKLNASSPAVRFISGRKYETLQDEALLALGNRARKIQLLAVATFLTLVLSMLANGALYE
jgi:hypothetical protein